MHCLSFRNRPTVLKEYEYIGISGAAKIVPAGMEAQLDKMVVLQSVTFRQKEFNHKILRAIDTNVILSRLTEAVMLTLS
jgi:DNA polymerase-3 subunit alpha/error-prone DNA polymerase